MIWTCLLLHIAAYTAMIIIFYIFPTLFSSFGLIGGAHPNDHFAVSQTGHFDHEHNNNLNTNNNNIFGGYNNYNTGGGIVSSSGGTPPHHLNIGSSISRSNINSNTNGHLDGIADSLTSSVSANIVAANSVTDQNPIGKLRTTKYSNLKFIEAIGYDVSDDDPEKYYSKAEQGATIKENPLKILDTINNNKFISKALSNSINVHLNKTLHDSNV